MSCFIFSEKALIDVLQNNKEVKQIRIKYKTESLPNLEWHIQALTVFNNRLNTFPSLDTLNNLRFLHLNRNNLKSFPSLDQTGLEMLYIDENKLRTLPSFDTKTGMRGLYINENELKQLPEHIKTMRIKQTGPYTNKFPKWLNYTGLVTRENFFLSLGAKKSFIINQ